MGPHDEVTVYVVNRPFNDSCPQNQTIQFGFDDDEEKFKRALLKIVGDKAQSKDLYDTGIYGWGLDHEKFKTLVSVVKMGGRELGLRHRGKGKAPWFIMEMTWEELEILLKADMWQKQNN